MEMESEHTVPQEVIHHVIITADSVKDKPFYDYIVIFYLYTLPFKSLQLFLSVFCSPRLHLFD